LEVAALTIPQQTPFMINLTLPIPRGFPLRRRMNIYRVAVPRVTESAVREISGRFGLSSKGKAATVRSDKDRLALIDGSKVVTLYRASGGVRYQDRSRWQIDDGRANTQISDTEAVGVARGHVGKLNLAPLNECEVLKVTRLRVGSAARDGHAKEERTIDVGVIFRRLIDGVRVDGPGGMIVVYLDHDANVTGVDRLWREKGKVLRPVTDLRPIERVAREVETRLGNGLSGKTEVRDLRFGYFEYGWRDNQRVIQPAYVALLTLYSPDARIHRRTAYVTTAATNPVGVITPVRKSRPKQRPRPSKKA
jgi:hypothetical protein